MNAIPELLAESSGIGLRYDHDVETFYFSGKREESITISELKNDPAEFEALCDKAGESPITKINSGVLLVLEWIVTTPAIRDILSSSQVAKKLSVAQVAIAKTYAKLTDTRPNLSEGRSHMKPDAFLRADGYAHFTTVGSCACLSANLVNGLLVEPEELYTGYTEYVLHNTDTPAQTISLLAGISSL